MNAAPNAVRFESADPYRSFLETKVKMAGSEGGFRVELEDLNPRLKPVSRKIVRWMLAGGRRALFASFGLHKTATQLEVMAECVRFVRAERAAAGLAPVARALIVLPYGVRQEFRRDACNPARESGAWDLGWEAAPPFVQRPEELGDDGVYLTNYETIRDGKLDPNLFDAVTLDEAAVLRSFGSKTYQTFLTLFERVRFKFVATATPSPNRYKELINYAGFLGVMDTGQALTRFFQRDAEKAGNLTLYPHKETEFWLWVASWALFVSSPSDLGESDDGYVLPPLDVRWHEVQVDHGTAGADKDGQGRLFRNSALGVTDAAREKRETLPARVVKMAQIVRADPTVKRIIWHDLESERLAIESVLPTCVSVFGEQDLDQREDAIVRFSDGWFDFLATKPVIAGAGCNFQRHCNHAVFLGVGFKFHDFIQAVHRLQRFGQTKAVVVDVIYAESERETLRSLQTKWRQHEEMSARMREIIKKYGLSEAAMAEQLTRSIGVAERLEVSGERWLIANNDTVVEARSLADASLDLIVTSIPFSNQYEYTPSYNDFGHTSDNAEFWAQMDHLTPELLRALKPGRVAAIHVKDRMRPGNLTGEGRYTVEPFHAEAIFHYRRHGFRFMGMITVTTDVVFENNQSYRLSYGEMLKDSTKMGCGSPEYVLLFHRQQSDTSRGYADTPVAKDPAEYSLAQWQVDAHGLWRSSGDRLMTPQEWQDLAVSAPDAIVRAWKAENARALYDYEHHVQVGEALNVVGRLPKTYMALPPISIDDTVWTDVLRFKTLNADQVMGGREKHVCPLQFDIVDRLINRYSAKGELVYDPFNGIGTVPVRAMKAGRRGRGVELNHNYFLDAVGYCRAIEAEIATPSLFDALGLTADNSSERVGNYVPSPSGHGAGAASALTPSTGGGDGR